jgi:predicted CopG family antitoxin
MNNPKQRQQWIYEELVKLPNTSFSDLFSIYYEKFSKSEVTFSKDWKKATEKIKQYQQAINNAKLEQSIETEKEAVKRNILTKLEAMEILTEIAQGKAKKIDGKIIMPSFTDRKGAIETLGKFDGWNSPNKTILSSDPENPIIPTMPSVRLVIQADNE